jgi:hypothetical protein
MPEEDGMKRWITWTACAGIIAALGLAQAGCARFSDKLSSAPSSGFPSASPGWADDLRGSAASPSKGEAP